MEQKEPVEEDKQELDEHKIVTLIDKENCTKFEQAAQTSEKGFHTHHHVCLHQPETVYEAFESFLKKIISTEEDFSRILSNDSKIFDDTMLTRNCCICRELNENIESRDNENNTGEFGLMQNTEEKKKEGDKPLETYNSYQHPNQSKHHPSCPMFKKYLRTNKHGLISTQYEDNSIVLRGPKLRSKRSSLVGSTFYELPPNQ